MNTLKIDNFWEWFVSQSERIDQWLTANDTRSLAREMQQRVTELYSEIGWEIGPGVNRRNCLAFTLNGDLERLHVIDAILRRAPLLPEWEFRAGRPRREYGDHLIFRNQSGQEAEICLQDWRYVLTAFDDGRFFDITVATSQRPRMDEAGQQQLLRTAVQAALGEVDAIKYVDRISFIDDPDADWEASATPFAYLAGHIDSLTRHWQS